ncbi:proton motive ATPase 1 [Trypanosoma grayi]|uniref:proton motive ATPase 1 n=1 Tax=Trypanosoma grayi TaxID=71804 RepID=UPI0004F40E47|nr:proton motive ATPase 1 [Trypanosoma grayi]KEG05768.1 proton motive ATPase 1 [Trypanosoma grayi]
MVPGLVLLIGAIISLFVSSMVASFWHESRPDGLLTEGLAWGDTNSERLLPLWVWIYCVVWWFIQDVIKVLSHMFMEAVDLFGCVSEAYGGKVIEQYVENQAKTTSDDANAGGQQEELMFVGQSGSAVEKGTKEPFNEGASGAEKASPNEMRSPYSPRKAEDQR